MKKITLLSLAFSVTLFSCTKENTTPAPAPRVSQLFGKFCISSIDNGKDLEVKFVGGVTKTANHKGVADAALQFDGKTGYVVFTDSASTTFKPDGLTVSIRAFLDSTQSSNPIIFKDNLQTSFNESFGLFSDGTYKFLAVAASGSKEPLAYSTSMFALKKWYHLAMTADADSIRLYVDGVKQSATATKFTLKHASTPLLLGRYAFSNRYFKGKLSDFRFYNKVLTNAEIATLSL